jgi:general stress protein 26
MNLPPTMPPIMPPLTVEPLRGRPEIDDYGVPVGEEGMLEWSYVSQRLAAAPFYWVATVGADGTPHAVPYFGAFIDDVLYFETGPATRGGRNLRANPEVAVHLTSGEEVVIIEGTARTAVPGAKLFADLQDAYRPKYDGYFPMSAENLFSVAPTVIFAWDLGDFPASMTRWQFRDPVLPQFDSLGDD